MPTWSIRDFGKLPPKNPTISRYFGNSIKKKLNIPQNIYIFMEGVTLPFNTLDKLNDQLIYQ